MRILFARIVGIWNSTFHSGDSIEIWNCHVVHTTLLCVKVYKYFDLHRYVCGRTALSSQDRNFVNKNWPEFTVLHSKFWIRSLKKKLLHYHRKKNLLIQLYEHARLSILRNVYHMHTYHRALLRKCLLHAHFWNIEKVFIVFLKKRVKLNCF